MFWVPLAAFVVGLGFSSAVARQYRLRRKPYQAAWAVALLFFALASMWEATGLLRGWEPLTYKLYYLFGAILDVGWLAIGTLALLGSRRVALAGAGVMAVVSLGAVFAVAVSHVDPAALRSDVPGRGAISAPATLLAPLTNIPGSLILVGGAAYSALAAHRRRAPAGRVAGTALIAAGAFVVAAGHSFAQLRGVYLIQPACEALGIAVMFGGYLAVEGRRRPHARVSTA